MRNICLFIKKIHRLVQLQIKISGCYRTCTSHGTKTKTDQPNQNNYEDWSDIIVCALFAVKALTKYRLTVGRLESHEFRISTKD